MQSHAIKLPTFEEWAADYFRLAGKAGIVLHIDDIRLEYNSLVKMLERSSPIPVVSEFTVDSGDEPLIIVDSFSGMGS